MTLPMFPGPQNAECALCELQESCSKGRTVLGRPPQGAFNGIMIVGEGPGATEVSRGEPFVGRSGRLLDDLLTEAGIERAECWVTNATLGLPPRNIENEQFHERFPGAIYACLPRLEREIEMARPRVIVALGQAALIALAGYTVERKRRVPSTCSACDPGDRKVGPMLACAVGTCSWMVPVVDDAHAKRIKEEHGGKCPTCAASIKRLKPRRVKCPACGGTKTREERYTTFEHDHKIGEIAGGVLDATKLPSRLDAFGVRWIIPTWHPSFCLRAVSSKAGQKKFGGQFAARPVVDHLAKAARLVHSDPSFALDVEITDSPADVWAYVQEPGTFTVDIETDSEEGVFAIGSIEIFGIHRVGQPKALVVDTRGILRGGLDEQGQPHPLLAPIAWFLTSQLHRKVLQNGGYDRLGCWWFWGGINLAGQIADTMLAHQVLYPDEPHSLAHIGFCLTDVEAWKPPKKRNGRLVFKDFVDEAIYNARDLRVTDIAAEKMGIDGRLTHGVAQLEGVSDAVFVDTRLLDASVWMTQAGMPVDADALRAIGDEARAVLDRTIDAMRTVVTEHCSELPFPDKDGKTILAPDWTPLNPTQLKWALFDPHGPLRLPVRVRSDKTQEPSTSKEALLGHADVPFVQTLLEWRRYQKVLSTYVEGDGLAPHFDGRIRPIWKVGGAVTGRWTSSPNLQNWPKALRIAIAAPAGRRLVGADYDQLELRVVASLSGDANLISRCMNADGNRKLEPDYDPHSYVASLVFGESFTGLDINDPAHRKTKPGEPSCKCQRCQRSQLRDITKRTIYGLNYGAGADTVLAAIYDGGYEGPPLQRSLIERVIRIVLHQAFPGVRIWREGTLARARHTREVRSPLLRRRRIFPRGEIDITIAYNYAIQSGAADIINMRYLALLEQLGHVDPTAAPIAQVHDALYFECAEDRADDVCALVTNTLTCEYDLSNLGRPPMRFSAVAEHGRTWKEV